MIDMAEHGGGEFLPLKEIADRQDISLKYIERIMPLLISSSLVEGRHGKGGGYRLTRDPEKYTVLEILTAAEGDLAPVACLKEGAPKCDRAANCRTLPFWQGYFDLTRDYFGGITLDTLTAIPSDQDYVI